jgi:hypothetical protein
MATMTDSMSYSVISVKGTVKVEPGKVIFGVVIGLDIILGSACGNTIPGVSA